MLMKVYCTKILVNLVASYQTQATYLFLGTQMVLLLLNLLVGQFGLFTLLSMNYCHSQGILKQVKISEIYVHV